MAQATTLKLPAKLKARIARLARQTGRSAHRVMLQALERGVTREERMREFVREALAADAAVEAGAPAYRAEDVHSRLAQIAAGAKRPRPR